jgi:hypothetical protein
VGLLARLADDTPHVVPLVKTAQFNIAKQFTSRGGWEEPGRSGSNRMGPPFFRCTMVARARTRPSMMRVANPSLHDLAAAELAVDREIGEHSKAMRREFGSDVQGPGAPAAAT